MPNSVMWIGLPNALKTLQIAFKLQQVAAGMVVLQPDGVVLGPAVFQPLRGSRRRFAARAGVGGPCSSRTTCRWN